MTNNKDLTKTLTPFLYRLWEAACAGEAQRPSCRVEDGEFVFTISGGADDYRSTLLRLAGVPGNATHERDGATSVYCWTSVADAIFGPNGMLARALPGYEPRPAQLHMARLIQRSIEMHAPAVVEAGTGTGKSFAYAAVCMAMERSVVISTSNKNLQGQLVRKDLPFLQTLFPGRAVAVAVGKQNYVCRAKVEDAAAGRVTIEDPALREWYFDTKSGNVEDIAFAAPERELQAITADDDCTGRHCPHYASCFYYKAKDERLNADVVVTNHALLCQHAALPDAQLLPDTEVLVVDEAHQLASYARGALGHSLTAASLRRTVDLATPYVTPEALQYAQAHVAAFENALNGLWNGVDEAQVALPDGTALPAAATLERTLLDLSRLVWEGGTAQDAAGAKAEKRSLRIWNAAGKVAALAAADAARVRWLEREGGAPAAHVAPVDVSGFLGTFAQQQATVFTSATLATPTLTPFLRTVGLEDALQLVAPAPFDYPGQALLYAPPAGAPLPREAAWRPWMADEMRRLVTASRGGAFLLFTSYAAMQYALAELRYHFESRLRLTVLVQGTLPRAEIARRFREDGNAVLFATRSFFEGADIPGDALRLVVIDKLPFEAPSPLGEAMEAHLKAQMAAQGVNGGTLATAPFQMLRLPQMVIDLKQACGRLIRSAADRGVLAVLDARLRSTPYGRRTVLPALPPARLTSRMAHVEAFYHPDAAPALPQRTPVAVPPYQPTVELWG